MTKIEDHFLIFEDNGWDYEIPLEDLKSEIMSKFWVSHMSEKSWFTKEYMDILKSTIRKATGK